MSAIDRPEVAPFEEENSRLADGLKSCRAVIRNYRSLLTNYSGDTAARQALPLGPQDSAETSSHPSGDT